MANLLDTLRIGGTSMAAQQVAAQVTGNNISNANSPGYHRQDAVFVGMGSLSGIRDTRIERAVNTLLETQMGAQRGAQGFAQERATGLEFVVQAVGDMGPQGLNGAVSDLFASVRGLTMSPADYATRAGLVTAGQSLTKRFNLAADNLAAAQKHADEAIVSALPSINANLQSIANVNGMLAQVAGDPDRSAALLDQRDAILAELNQQAGATSDIEPNGSMSIFIANICVVSEIATYMLEAQPDNATGLHDIAVNGTTHTNIAGHVTGGSLGGQIALRDTDIQGAMGTLDGVAYDLATAFNTIHESGFDLSGNTGHNFFNAPAQVAGAAKTLALDSGIAANPRTIAAAASSTATPGDNTVALALSDLESSSVVQNNTQTFAGALASLVSSSGQSLSIARADAVQTDSLLAKTQALFEAQAGVSIDEQMLLLSRIQNSFQASAKLVEVTNRMLDSLQAL